MRVYSGLILRGWWAILALLFGAAVWLGSHAPKIEINAGTNAVLDKRDPDLAYYESTRPLWGYDEYAIVCLTREQWIDEQGLSLLARMVDQLREAPHVASITSVLDVPLLRQEEGPNLNPFNIPNLRSKNLKLDRAREEILDHTQAAGSLVSRDGRSVTLLVYMDVPAEVRTLSPEVSRLLGLGAKNREAREQLAQLEPRLRAASKDLDGRRLEMVTAIREFTVAWEQELPEPVRLSGPSIIYTNVTEHLQHDLMVFGLAALALFVLGFLLVYRRARFVVLPILACVLPVALILGAMAFFDMKLTVITANLPVLLFTLMLPYTVYFVERYLERRSWRPDEPGEVSTAKAASKIWAPCFFSCVTTMAGFAALMTSGTIPVHDFGLMMAMGMGIGLAVVFLAIPSMSRPLPALTIRESGIRTGPRFVVKAFAFLALRVPVLIVALGVLILVFAILGASRLSAQSKFTEYFKAGTQVYDGLEFIDTRMGGTTTLEVMLTSKEPKFFLTPPGRTALESVQTYFKQVPETGTVRSLATLIDELEKKSPEVAKQIPLLAVHPVVRSVTREFANEDYTVSRVIVRMRETAPTLDRNVILGGLRRHLERQEALKGLEVRETGMFVLYANMLNTLMDTQRETFLFVLAAIYLMLLLLFRSPVLALLIVLTQTLPAATTLGLMGWAGITLDLVTVMIASIAMGVGIDAAIQYTFRFRIELDYSKTRKEALVRAHATIGRSIWIATTVIIAGFCVLTLSEFRPSIYLGLLTSVAMLMSQIAALTILPSIFLLTKYPKRRLPKPDVSIPRPDRQRVAP